MRRDSREPVPDVSAAEPALAPAQRSSHCSLAVFDTLCEDTNTRTAYHTRRTRTTAVVLVDHRDGAELTQSRSEMPLLRAGDPERTEHRGDCGAEPLHAHECTPIAALAPALRPARLRSGYDTHPQSSPSHHHSLMSSVPRHLQDGPSAMAVPLRWNIHPLHRWTA